MGFQAIYVRKVSLRDISFLHKRWENIYNFVVILGSPLMTDHTWV